jgi:hypothetical protein
LASVARFAGDAFRSEGKTGGKADGAYMRALVAELAWKKPPSSKLSAEVST